MGGIYYPYSGPKLYYIIMTVLVQFMELILRLAGRKLAGSLQTP